MQSRRHVIHPAHAILPKAREIHPAPLANEGGRLRWYRTREAAEEALIPVALLTQLADTSCVKSLAEAGELDGAAVLSHPEENNHDRCVADEHPLISCADLDALDSVSIGSNHHPNPKFLSTSALWQLPPVPVTTAKLLPGPCRP